MSTDYLIFVLAYDLLHDKLNNLKCDLAYDVCLDIAKDFILSDYSDLDKSIYDCLVDYLNDGQNNLYIIALINEKRGVKDD